MSHSTSYSPRLAPRVDKPPNGRGIFTGDDLAADQRNLEETVVVSNGGDIDGETDGNNDVGDAFDDSKDSRRDCRRGESVCNLPTGTSESWSSGKCLLSSWSASRSDKTVCTDMMDEVWHESSEK